MATYEPIELDEEVIVQPTTTPQFEAIDMDQVTVGDTWTELEDRHQPWFQPGMDFLEGLNRAAASAVQIPFDVGRAAHQVIWGGDVASWLPNFDPDHPTAGAGAIDDLLTLANATGPQIGVEVDPSGVGYRVGKHAALNLATAYPLLKGAQAAKYTWGWFDQLVDYVRTNPLKAILFDVGLSIPMGVGEYIGEKIGWPDPETGGQLGTIAGSTVLAAPYLGWKAVQGILSKVKGVKGLGLTPEAREKLATDLLEGVMTKDQLAALKAGDYEMPEVGGSFTTGEVLNAGGLSRLRQSIIDQSTPAQEAEKLRIIAREDDLVAALSIFQGDNTQSEASRFLARRIMQTLSKMRVRVDRAKADAQVRIDRLGRNVDPEVAAKIAREEFDKAYQLAREDERGIWSKIGDGRFTTDAVVQRAKEIIAATPRLSGEKGQPDLPIAILEIAGKDAVFNEKGEIVREAVPSTLRAIESITEISALSSRINRDIREAYSQGKTNLARLLGQLRDSIYDDIIPVGTVDQAALSNARKFSRVLNDKFTRGAMGTLLSTKSTGALAVDPELTLTRLVTPGPVGKIAVQKLLESAASMKVDGKPVRDSTEAVSRMNEMIQQHLLNQFALKTTNSEGIFSPGSAVTFVRSNPSLDLFPKLKAQMLDASEGQRLYDSVSVVAKNRANNINKQAIASRVTNSEIPIAISEIFRSKNPIKDIDSLLRSAAKDESGDTLGGIKSALYDHIISKITRVGSDPNRNIINVEQANAFINNKTNRAVVRKVYGEVALRLLDAVQKGMLYQARGRDLRTPAGAKARGAGLAQEFAGNLGTLLGARLLGGITGHTLLAAGIGKRYALRFVNLVAKAPQDEILAILQKALEDPGFARDLLVPLRRFTTEQAMGLYKYQIIKDMINKSASIDSEQVISGADAVRSSISAY